MQSCWSLSAPCGGFLDLPRTSTSSKEAGSWRERQNAWFVHEVFRLDGDYEDILTEAAAELAGLGYDRHRNFWNTPMRSGAEGVSGVMLTEGDDCVVVLVTSSRFTWRVRMQFWTYRVKRRLSRTASPPRPPP